MKRKQPAAPAGTPPPEPVGSTQQAAAMADGDCNDERALQIREAAYFRYLARGAAVGREMEDWLQAEAELLAAQEAGDTSH